MSHCEMTATSQMSINCLFYKARQNPLLSRSLSVDSLLVGLNIWTFESSELESARTIRKLIFATFNDRSHLNCTFCLYVTKSAAIFIDKIVAHAQTLEPRPKFTSSHTYIEMEKSLLSDYVFNPHTGTESSYAFSCFPWALDKDASHTRLFRKSNLE